MAVHQERVNGTTQAPAVSFPVFYDAFSDLWHALEMHQRWHEVQLLLFRITISWNTYGTMKGPVNYVEWYCLKFDGEITEISRCWQWQIESIHEQQEK